MFMAFVFVTFPCTFGHVGVAPGILSLVFVFYRMEKKAKPVPLRHLSGKTIENLEKRGVLPNGSLQTEFEVCTRRDESVI